MSDIEETIKRRVLTLRPGELEARVLKKIGDMSDPVRDKNTGCSDYVAGNRRVHHCTGNLHIAERWEFNHVSDLADNVYNLIVVDGTLSFAEKGQIVTRQNLAIRTTDFTADARELLPDKAHILSIAGQDGNPVSSYAGQKADPGADGKSAGRTGGHGPDSDFLGDNAGNGKTGITGDHGDPGDPGNDGEDGNSGTHGGFLSLVTDTFSDTWLIMAALGGNGSDGGSGGDGGDGGHGKKGGQGGNGGDASVFGDAGDGGAGGQGGDAGRGGKGGDAGLGGDGGNGGQITVRYTRRFSQPRVPELFVNAGKAGSTGVPGDGGKTGSPGDGGEPGEGGDEFLFYGGGDRGPDTSKKGNIPPKAKDGVTPSIAVVNGQPGSRNGGVRWAEDPEIWPYAGLLSEGDWMEVLENDEL